MELDSEQQAVVNYDDSCVVIAGPGSGKTRTLVAKAEKLWNEGKDIICLTFTRAAAGEMRSRMPGINARTIHSYCYKEVGFPGDYDRMLHNFNEQPKKDSYQWVLIDEVQDLTEEELEVVLSIMGDKIFAVGDPFQSIYGFNGALGERIFNKLPYKRFDLTNNYRSCPKIVTRLNQVYTRGLVSRNVKDLGTTAILTRRRGRTDSEKRQGKKLVEGSTEEASLALEKLGIGHTLVHGGSELSKRVEEDKGNPNLKVMTCHCSKGLEFDWVILYKWHPEPYWGEEKRLLYVSMSRASKGFCTVWDNTSLKVALRERRV